MATPQGDLTNQEWARLELLLPRSQGRRGRPCIEHRRESALSQYLAPEVLVIYEVNYLNHGPYAADVLFPVVETRYLRGDRPMLLTRSRSSGERCCTIPTCRRRPWTGCCTDERS